MQITATHITYLHLCHRKLWLFANSITMEQTSDTVYEGKLIGETTYLQRPDKYTELEIEGVKIDFYDAKNKVVHEIKKSDKLENAHIAQVKYYLYVLERNGIFGATGILEYPKLRQTQAVLLTDEDRTQIQQWESSITEIIESETCPPIVKKTICKSCSYFDFCFVSE